MSTYATLTTSAEVSLQRSDASQADALTHTETSASRSGTDDRRALPAGETRLGRIAHALLRRRLDRMLRREAAYAQFDAESAGSGTGTGGAPAEAALSLRQRVSLVIGTSLTAEAVVAMPDEAIHHAFFVEHRIGAPLLRAAGISVAQLKARGTDSAEKLAALGFSSLHLTDESFCTECVAAYGADAVLAQFFVSPSDAIVLAGSPAVELLGLDVGTLLLLCADRPSPAREVLLQCAPYGGARLRGVPPQTLIETGLTAPELLKLGLDAEAVRQQTLASPADLYALGFT